MMGEENKDPSINNNFNKLMHENQEYYVFILQKIDFITDKLSQYIKNLEKRYYYFLFLLLCSILAFLDVSTSGIGMYLFLFQMYLGAIILLVFSFNKILLIKTLMDFGDTVGNVSIVKGMKNILNITYLSIPCLIAYIPANFAIFLNFVPCASYGSCGNLDKPLLYIIVLWGTYMGLFIIPKLYAYKIIQKGVVDLTVQFEISASLIQNSFKLILNGQRFVTIFPPIYWKFIRGFKQINLEFMRFVNQKKIYN